MEYLIKRSIDYPGWWTILDNVGVLYHRSSVQELVDIVVRSGHCAELTVLPDVLES
jgi:hypothetical protein